METWVYKGSRKADAYLYIKAEDDFSRVPQVLLGLFGKLELVLKVDLSERKQLAQVDIEEVKSKLKSEGFYMQMPLKEKESRLDSV